MKLLGKGQQNNFKRKKKKRNQIVKMCEEITFFWFEGMEREPHGKTQLCKEKTAQK